MHTPPPRWAPHSVRRAPTLTIPPPAGIQTATDTFSAADLLYINSLFSLQTVVRQVGGSPPYYCTVSECQAAKPCWVLGVVDGGQRGERRAGPVQCPQSAGGKCHAGMAISTGQAAAVLRCPPPASPTLHSTVVGNKQPLSSAGCLPQDYSPVYGRAIEGPVYAGIGPPTALTRLSSASEPDEAGRGYTIEITATLVISSLREGARYKVGWLTGRVAQQAGWSGWTHGLAMDGSMAAGQQEGSAGCRWVLPPCMHALAGMPKLAHVPTPAPTLFSRCVTAAGVQADLAGGGAGSRQPRPFNRRPRV